MSDEDSKSQHILEVFLVLIAIGLIVMLNATGSHKITVLNLFYLPVVLAGFFLGRYRAGVLAFFCVVMASTVVVLNMNNFAPFTSPVAAILAVTVWSVVLGLTALLVGTLSDERIAKATEAHEAHFAVVDVLSRYLQSANPKLRIRATRTALLSEQVARKMRLSHQEIDDIRIASRLMDIENIEITARVIKKAVGTLEDENDQHTIAGTELVQSLRSVLKGAFPLVLSQADAEEISDEEMPFGARILHTVRAYDELVYNLWDDNSERTQDAMEELENDFSANHHPAVLHALHEVLATRDLAESEQDPVDRIEALLAQDR